MFKGPLHEIVERFSTNYWVHSCLSSQIDYALNYGATGITIDSEMMRNSVVSSINNYNEIIKEILVVYPDVTEEIITDFVYKYTIRKVSDKVSDIYHNSLGKKGRVSISPPRIQYNDYQNMLDKIIEYKEVTSNIYVEIPASSTGIDVIEEATYQGFSINATDVYSVSQVRQIIIAVQKGLNRREVIGKDSTMIHPICTVNNCKLKKIIKQIDPSINSEGTDKYCIHIIKTIYKVLLQKGFVLDLNVSFNKYDDTWKEYVGDELTLSFSYDVIKKINDMDLEIDNFIENTKPIDLTNDRYNEKLNVLYKACDDDEFIIDAFFEESLDEEYEKLIEVFRTIKKNQIEKR